MRSAHCSISSPSRRVAATARSGKVQCAHWKVRGSGESVIIGEKYSTEVPSKSDIDPVGERDVRTQRPSIREQAAYLGDSKGPGHQLGNRSSEACPRQHSVEVPATKHGAALDVENLRDPRHGSSG